MTDDQFFLANAYLDGELTAEERALADADPEVLAEVERLRALQMQIQDVEAPGVDARERAITAALAEFRVPAVTATTPMTRATPASGPIPLRARPAYTRFLGIAAAVVAVGVLGLVVATALRGSDDDAALDSATAGTVTDAPTELDASSEAYDDAPEAGAAEPTADAADGDASDAGAAEAAEATAADEAESAADDDEGALDAPAPTLASPSQNRIPPAAADAGIPLTSPDELAEFVLYNLAQIEQGVGPPTPETDCEVEGGELPIRFLAQALYLENDEPVAVLVGIDGDELFAVAVDPSTDPCRLVEAAPLG